MSVVLQQHCVFWIYLQGLHFIDDRVFDAERMLKCNFACQKAARAALCKHALSIAQLLLGHTAVSCICGCKKFGLLAKNDACL